MKRALVVLCIALTGCAAPTRYTPIVPTHGPRNGDIRVHVPHSHDPRKENADGAAACAQYGRVAVPGHNHRHHGQDYECVDPGAAPN